MRTKDFSNIKWNLKNGGAEMEKYYKSLPVAFMDLTEKQAQNFRRFLIDELSYEMEEDGSVNFGCLIFREV